MKGIIFNLLEDVVGDHYGDAVWDSLLLATDNEGIYSSLGSYPDAELIALVETASSLTGTPVRTLLHWFGRHALPKIALRYPEFFTNAPDARSFILSVNTIIHPEVRKLYAGAGCPHFHFSETPDTLTLGYQSARQLCDLAHGFIDGVAAHYGETLTFHETSCMHEGAPSCQMVVTWLT